MYIYIHIYIYIQICNWTNCPVHWQHPASIPWPQGMKGNDNVPKVVSSMNPTKRCFPIGVLS